ncbi:mandelate racemase/muconate lactonizing enzyme family protein [Candidatus Poribacteria bacterium]|nr:mandelate racemase/muconate lactonizing enzyme family protein [Candidatus Poribacteria bacterium]
MKITNIRTLCLSRPHEPEQQWFTATFRSIKADGAIVIIDTDDGLQGIGEACAYGVPPRIREEVERLSQGLIGRDPTDSSIMPHPKGNSGSYDIAVAGIDCALWDIRGKVSGKKVAELLTEKPLNRVRLYASSGCQYDWGVRPEQVIEEAVGYADEGYTACKVRIGTEWSWDGVTVARFVGLMRELKETVGDRMELMVEGNQRFSEEQAMELALELDRMGFTWFEEPIPQANIDGYVRLNAAVKMPISGGEQFTTLERFESYLQRGAYGIVQPDAGMCGITEGMRIGRRAHEFGVDLCPHNWHNGLMTMANAHLVAALPNPRVLELCRIQGPLQWAMLKEPPVIKSGWLELPDRPGLGVELAEDLEERFPYIDGPYAIRLER